jgi:hypothetical protein
VPVIVRYAVRNQEGLWFRAKGRDGYGDSWTNDQSKARLYGQLGQARSRRTFFASRWPSYGAPDIVKLECDGVVLEDAAQLKKATAKVATKKERAAARRAKWELETAQREVARAQAALLIAQAKATARNKSDGGGVEG